MWVPKEVADWFRISKDSVDALREELAATRADRDAIKEQLLFVKSNFEWLRLKVNQLEVEKAALLQKAIGIPIPAPEIVSRSINGQDFDPKNLSFDDIGEDMARKLGFPSYSDRQ